MEEKAQSPTSSVYSDMLSSTASSAMAHRTMRRIFVFQVPTRVFHWINVLSIFALIGTGLIMGNPPAIQTGTEASSNYWFGINRFIHFASAWLFTFNWFFRIFWSFIGGNRWENWRNFIPYKKEQWKEIWEIIKLDVFMIRNVDHLSIGHNSLAGFSYFLLFILSVIMMITGFGMYSAMSDSWFAGMFSWIIPLLGGDMAVRFIHHALMWLFIIFTFVHIYLVFYHDYIEGRGEISSIGGGWKFIEEDCIEKHDNKEC